MAYRSDATSAAVGAGLPAIALQLHDAGARARSRRAIAPGQNPRRRHLSRHRLPGEEPSVHRQHHGLPQSCRNGRTLFTSEQFHVVAITDLHIANLPDEHYTPYDSGIAGDHFVKNPDGSVLHRPGVARPQRLSRLHAAADHAPGGARSTRLRPHRHRRLLERHGRALGLHRSQDHARQHRSSHRRAGLHHAYRDTSRDPQCVRHGELPRHLRWPADASARSTAVRSNPCFLCRRPALRGHLDRATTPLHGTIFV